MLKKKIGDKIKKIRKQQCGNLSMEEFGKLFNPPASKGVVSNWENNYNYPNNERLKVIAKLGDISLDELLQGESPSLLIEWAEEQLGNVELTNLLKDCPEVHYNKGYVDALLDVLDYINQTNK